MLGVKYDYECSTCSVPVLHAGWVGSPLPFIYSGKSVCSIENFIQREILPSYGNTHTSASFVGKQEGFAVTLFPS